MHVLPILSSNKGIKREFAWPEGEDEDGSGEKGISVGFIELFRIAEDGKECFAFRSPKRYEH